jgi:hypothetical protein
MGRYVLVIFLCDSLLCLAEKSDPDVHYYALLDKLADQAMRTTPERELALTVLERVALGRVSAVSAEEGRALGLAATELEDRAFLWPSIRAYAFRRIGEVPFPNAFDFLSKVTLAEIGADSTQQVRASAEIALKNSLLIRISEPRAKVEFLERTLSEERMHYGGGAVVHWTVDQLCDIGAVSSLVIVRQAIRKQDSSQRGEEEIQFCEARARVISSHPDRVVALTGVLHVQLGQADERLLRWAIIQLGAMRSTSAYGALDRFADEIANLPRGPQKQRLDAIRQEIVVGRTSRRTMIVK